MNGIPESFFQSAYVGDAAPWDIGRPQPAIVELEASGGFGPRVLDVGCGQGDNTIHLASRGHDVIGIDFVPRALDIARERAARAGVSVDWRVHDALRLGELGQSFDTVLDSALFHVFSDEDRPRFARSVASVLRPGGSLIVLCFSDAEPPGPGPRRVSEAELRATFSSGWRVESVHSARFLDRMRPDGARAWLARIVRLEG